MLFLVCLPGCVVRCFLCAFLNVLPLLIVMPKVACPFCAERLCCSDLELHRAVCFSKDESHALEVAEMSAQ